MKIRKNGFSVVEIMVSMVILSIVMLVMTNVIAVSSKQHKAAQQNDDGEYVARKKLSELLHPSATIPTASTSSVSVPYKNINYAVSWEVSGNSPILVTVKAKWTGNGHTDSAVVAGYLEKSNNCPSPNATKPTLKIYNNDGSVNATGEFTLVHGTPIDANICRIEALDQDDGDAATFTIEGGDEDWLKMSGDTIKAKKTFTTPTQSTPYKLIIKVQDCRKNDDGTFRDTVFVHVGAANSKTKPKQPQVFEFNENDNSTTKKLEHFEGTSLPADLTWEISGTDASAFTLTHTSPTREGVIKATSMLNFESKSSYAFKATLKRANKQEEDVTVDVTVNVKDVNENPSDIALSSLTYFDTTNANTVVSNITVTDPDAGSSTPAWNTHTLTLTGGWDYLKLSSDNKQLLVDTKKAQRSTDTTLAIKLKATDNSVPGLSSPEKSFSIVVKKTGGTLCSSRPSYVSSIPYATGAQVSYDNGYWKAKKATQHNPPSDKQYDSFWLYEGVCQ